MTSDMKKTILNTRERFTSTKYNSQVAIHDRNLQEAMQAMLGADVDASGVIGGLVVSVQPASMDVLVGKGMGLLLDATKLPPDSQFRWIEVESPITATVAAADPANPRWDVIEILPGVASTGSFARDIFDPALGTFSSVNVSIEERSNPTVQIRSGTPAASPAFPAGTAGAVPLAYILVPAAAVSLPTDGLVHCRPMIRSAHEWLGGGTHSAALQVRGGGLDTDAATLATVSEMRGVFPGSRIGFLFKGDITYDTVNSRNIDAADPPTVGNLFYAYLVAAPYPTGYDASIAVREFIPGGAAAYAEFVSVNTSSNGAIIVFSARAPVDTNDPQGASAGNGTIAEPAFGGAVTSDRTSWVYIGGARIVGTGFNPQRTASKAKIYLVGNTPELLLITDGSGLVPVWASSVGGLAAEIPATAKSVDGILRIEWVIPNGASTRDFAIDVTDQTGAVSSIVSDGGAIGAQTPLSPNTTGKSYSFSLYPDPTNGDVNFALTLGGPSNLSEVRWISTAYEDSILARR